MAIPLHTMSHITTANVQLFKLRFLDLVNVVFLV